ncbi:helix-turn-helix domain-containing protein [Streptomyces sp. NBC_01428]|uniref:helix-turn-helix domain-containing protein n=1 Tax=Streptomyces sp. NBC_01428 TaxID=2903861 RepID=UPI002E2F9BC2|nr:helix-turn-helix domain-containing protein [Streptomyces sp. NBC_01428]
MAQLLQQARRLARLSFRQLEEMTGVASSSLNRAAKGHRTSWEVVEAFAHGCGADPEEALAAWQRAQPVRRELAAKPQPQNINTFGDLVWAMRVLRARHSKPPTLREVESAGSGLMPRSTLSSLLGSAPPRRVRKDLLLAYMRAMGETVDQVEQWGAAWERANANYVANPPVPVRMMVSPALLSQLADPELPRWNCVAALVDQASAGRRDGRSKPIRVSLALEAPSDAGGRPSLRVSDDGPGLDADSLLQRLSDGWTTSTRGRNRAFGVSFNIATMRLGTLITIRTAQAEMRRWAVLKLDLRALVRSPESDWITLASERKAKSSDHGTHIAIDGLRESWSDDAWQQLRIRLGDLYSYPLREGQIEITMNGRKVRPRMPCVWGEHRSVTRYGSDISAVQRIDSPQRTVHECLDCGHRGVTSDVCVVCGGGDLRPMTAHIWGWVGVQRYLDRIDYGLDFYRNGRKILTRDKKIFEWHDDDTGKSELEYPIELGHRGGRIVGEVHCDHLRVTPTMDAFAHDPAAWRAVVEAVRGTGPLRPRYREMLGYGVPNTSPLGTIFSAFRRVDPGLRCLIPGDGLRAIHEEARRWAEQFHKGDPRYQSDDVWYEAVLHHEGLGSARQLPPDVPR